jgi:DNA-binding MarR family transcriptional regulator
VASYDFMSKECTRCRKKLKISKNFFKHRDFAKSQFSDLWCSNCVKKYVKDKKTLMEYCEANYRVFQEKLWNYANVTIAKKLETDERYMNLSLTEKQKELEREIIPLYFRQMGQPQYYKIVKDPKTNGCEYDPDKENFEDAQKIYSQEWRGMYSQEEIAYLDKYYADLLNDYNIVTRNHKDYAKKVAQASLYCDKCYENIIKGVPKAEENWKTARKIFDDLCQSAKFSEIRRTQDEVTGLGSFGELVKRIEEDGFIQTKITFEKDSIDILLNEFRHTFKALRGISDGE